MSATRKPEAGGAFPDVHWNAVGGGSVELNAMDGWRMLVVYRGRHCPICKKYLAKLNDLREQFEQAGIGVAAVSADPEDRASEEAREQGWSFPVAYGLSVEDMHRLGLYVSDPRSPQETDRPFAEPGVFVINPDGCLQVVDISNAPFARPDLQQLLDGLKFVQDKDYPVRGTH